MSQPVSEPFNVLILCTGNSARSIMAEGLLNARGGGRYRAFSAGSKPSGRPHPLALAQLEAAGIDTGFARSKSWDEFAAPGAPRLDLVVTVCDSAAAETCPYWPGAPMRAHWGLPDPAAVTGEGAEAAFAQAFAVLDRRMTALAALDLGAPGFSEALATIGHQA